MSLTAAVHVDYARFTTLIRLRAPQKGDMLIHVDAWTPSRSESLAQLASGMYGELYAWISPKKGASAHMTLDQAEKTINYLKEAN